MHRPVWLRTILIGALALPWAIPGVAQAQGQAPLPDAQTRDANLRAYTELLRTDIRRQAAALITDIMQFSEAEDAKFWPVYREYETELTRINDERLALIGEYAASYTNLSDSAADRLALGALSLEDRRQALKRKYYDRFKTVLSPTRTLRFFQVENQILLLLDLQIAASLPIVE